FGHPNSSIIFPPAGTLPTSMSAKLTIGAAPSWRAGAIQRQFDIIQTGGISTKAIIRQHYLDSELNGNIETKLVFWGHKVTGSVDFEQGKSSNNSVDNWVEISNANVAQYFENQFGKVYITLDDTQGIGQIVWNGSVSDSWTTIENWTPNVKPGTDTKVIIPDATTTNNDPTLNPSETIGSLVIETGAIVNSTDTSQLFLTAGAGAWQNNGIFNPGTGTSSVTFNNLDATISGSTTFNNVTIPIGGGIRPSEGNYMSIAGNLTNNGTMFTTLIPNTIEFKGTNQIIPAPGGESFGGYHHLIVNGTGATFASTTLNVRGNLTLNQTVPFTGKTINLAGVSDQIIAGTAAINFNNLIVNKETGAVILAKDITVGGTLTLTKGNLVIGDKNLTLGSNAVSGTFGTNTMIVADGTGVVRRPYAIRGSYLFPIGELDGAPSYAPITVELTAGDFSNAFVGVNVTHSKHPNNSSVQNYLDKYWNVQQTGISNAVATITAKYDPADISGPQGEIAAAQLNGVFNVVTNPWKKFGVLSNNTLVAENAILTSGQISAFTGLKAGTISLEVYGYGDFCLNSTHTMNAVTSGGDAPFTYEWSNGLPNAVQVDIPTTTVGKTDYTLTVRDSNGFSATDTNIPVYIFPQSNGGIIAMSTQQICAGTVPAELKLTGSVGEILHWQKSTDINFSANTESNPNNVTNLSNFTTTLSGAEIGPVTATTYIRAVLQNGDCAEKYSSVATVIIKTTTWNGATLGWSDGLPNATTSLIFAKDYTTSAAEKLEACSCEVNNGVVLTVNPNTSITIKDAIINNGSVIIESDGNLIQLNDAAINSGNVLVKRKLTFRNADRKEYNYLISPVENGNLKTDLYRKDDGSAVIAPSVLYYNETNNRFYNSSGAYIPGRSLAIKEPAYNSGAVPIAFFYGKPVNGKVAYSLAFSGESFGYNLVGNPYPSNLDLNVLFKDNSTSIEPTFRFWDNTVNGIYEQLGSNYTGNAYAIFNAVTGPGGTGVSAVGVGKIAGESPRIPNNIVKVGQGFMVKAVGENKVLNYSNHIRLEDNTGSVFYGKSKQDDRYWLHMTAPSGITSTIAVVYFAGGNNLFGAEDSRALENSDLIYSIVQGEQVSIDGRSSFSNADEISLGTQHFTAGNYTIALGDQEGVFSQGQNIYLKDKQMGIVTNLSEDGYVFAANSGASTGRFEIIYRPETVLVTDTKVKESITVYRDQDDFVVKSPKIMSMIQVYDSSGKLMTVLKANDKRAIFNVSGVANGMYVLKITTVDGEVVNRKISR
ncbi:MAG: T9SS type A sorting domain-containing protein, partial [Flavobacteriales bacterium]|nr:T9SS type A sorting domain-containing protein [Flavobacteriales bacterium]